MSAADDPIRVLHVDPDPEFLDVASTIVERESDRIEVVTATSADEGLDRLDEEAFDCVVSDYDMPGADGVDFLEMVRERDDSLPFVLYTGQGSEEVASEAIAAGVTDYLQKGSGESQYALLVRRITNAVEQHRARAAAERSRRRLHALLENSMDRLSVLDKHGEYQYVSPSVEHLMGYDPDELVGTAAFEKIHPADREPVRAKFEEVVAEPGRADTAEYRYEDADGEWHWVESHAKNRLDDPHVEGVIINSREITERKERERELWEEREFVERALDTLDDAFYVIGTDHELERWNQQLVDATGYSDEEIAEMRVEELFPESERERVEAAIDEALSSGRATVEAEFERAGGDRRSFEFTGTRLSDEEGEPVGLVGTARDVTERKERERELRRQNKRLEEFVSVVSHDLRNPLNVAEGRLELARADHESEHLDAVAGALDRMGALIDDLLTLAREGDRVADLHPVALSEIVEKCWDNVATGDATLDVTATGTVRADADRLQQLLENVIRNAVEHGGEDVTVTVGDLPDGFYVADDGPGIPAGKRDRVFDTNYSTSDEGTGLGLSIVDQIAEAHDWTVDVVESEAGGARFEVTGVDVR